MAMCDPPNKGKRGLLKQRIDKNQIYLCERHFKAELIVSIDILFSTKYGNYTLYLYLCTNLNHVVTYYFTGNVTSFQLMPLFWKVVAALETTAKLWVLAAVNDGASPNRRFFALQCKLGGKLLDGLVYKTPNLFYLGRMIFFTDVPHLMKTARNCLYNNSRYGSQSRCMWNDCQYLLFRFVLYTLNLKNIYLY